MARTQFLLMVLIVQGFSWGCLGGAGALAPCSTQAPSTAICDLTNPEDIGLLPDGSWIIVSEMAPNDPNVEPAGSGSRVGRLTGIRSAGAERVPLYPTASMSDEAESDPRSAQNSGGDTSWGDASCPGEPDRAVFRPHGIDVGSGPNGQPMVAVVNHGGREAVEFFEIVSGDAPSLAWRGCVPMPKGITINDVALLPGGGFVVTNFMPAFEGVGPKAIWTMLKISFGARTGSVLEWTAGSPIKEIENSEGSAPNGIEVSADGSMIFVAEWGGEVVYRLRLRDEGPPIRDEIEVDHSPDNLTWASDGRLLVAGHEGGVSASLGCASVEGAGCDVGYSVYAISPVVFEATKLFEGRGAASVALEVGDEIYVGFYVGDQIERVERAE